MMKIVTLLQIKRYCSSCRHTGERQTLLRSTSTETSGSFDKPRRESVIARVKELIPIMKVFFPITMYWAVSYQRFSSFILQSLDTNCYLGSIEVPPGMYTIVRVTVYTVWCHKRGVNTYILSSKGSAYIWCMTLWAMLLILYSTVHPV